jgi:hypothetical protein
MAKDKSNEKLEDINFDEIMNGADYWIDGPSYEMREEIKSWGGYWNEEKRRWQIDNILPGEIIWGAFRAIGLRLIKRGKND